jgi:hypothetical protein
MKNQFKDRYSQAIILIVLGLIVAIVVQHKYGRNTGTIIGIAGFIYLAILATKEACIIENEYQGKAYYKCENDCQLMELAPLQLVCGIDGIKTNSNVYKTSNGSDVVIDKAGNIKAAGFGSALINSFNSKPLDANWKPLIEI